MLGLFVLDHPDKKVDPKVVMLLSTIEEIQNCFFTDGVLGVSQDRAAMDEVLSLDRRMGIGQSFAPGGI